MTADFEVGTQLFQSWWPTARDFLESNFVAAAIGSFAGALGGAWAAQRIAERAKYRDELQKEVRDTNAATMVAYSIANTHINLKKQHVKALYEGFSEEANRFREFLAAKAAGTVPPQQVFTFNANLETMQTVRSPIAQLERLAFDKISLSSELLFVVQTLISTVESLSTSMEERNRIALQWRTQDVNPFHYFGVQLENVMDQRYKDFVTSIHSQTDDVIFFSNLVGEKLYEHADNKRSSLRKVFGVKGPSISKADFTNSADLLPPSENYPTFTQMFDAEKKDEPKRWFWQKAKK